MVKITRIIRSSISLIPYVGGSLENLIFGSIDDKKQEQIERKLKEVEETFDIERDENGNIKSTYDCGVYK